MLKVDVGYRSVYYKVWATPTFVVGILSPNFEVLLLPLSQLRTKATKLAYICSIKAMPY